jgi:hypothetical protein
MGRSLGPNLPLVEATDLYLPPGGSFLRAATYGRGVWEIPLRGFASLFDVRPPFGAAFFL